jgi:hypothetical protein
MGTKTDPSPVKGVPRLHTLPLHVLPPPSPPMCAWGARLVVMRVSIHVRAWDSLFVACGMSG